MKFGVFACNDKLETISMLDSVSLFIMKVLQ